MDMGLELTSWGCNGGVSFDWRLLDEEMRDVGIQISSPLEQRYESLLPVFWGSQRQCG